MRIAFLTACLAALSVAAPLARGARIETGSLVFDGVSPPDAAVVSRLAPWLAARGATFRGWLPEGAILVTTRFGDVEQAHRVAMPLGTREQLTFLAAPVVGAAAVPIGAAGFAFLQEEPRGRNAQVWFRDAAGGPPRRLTDGRGAYGPPVWSRDGRRVAFSGNSRDAASVDVYVGDPASAAPARMLVAATGRTWSPLDWSPDGARLLLEHYAGPRESELYLADVDTGGITAVPIDGRPLRMRMASFAPDGRGIHFIAERDQPFAQLWYCDPVSGDVRAVLEGVAADVEAYSITRDGRYLAWVANVDGASRLTVLDQVARAELTIPALPAPRIVNLAFDGDGRRLALTLEGGDQPRDVYVYEPGGALTRWTRSEAGPAPAAALAAAELVRFPTWDRVDGRPRAVPAFVYRPKSAGPHPVVILLHGETDAQARPAFDPFVQFLVSEGFAVIAPNVRGSAGYGRAYAELAGGRREDAVRDVGSLLVWIGVQAGFDRRRIAIVGGGGGGALLLASLAQYGDRLGGAVQFAGDGAFETILPDAGDAVSRRRGVFPQRVPAAPNPRAIRRPLLVVQGLDDPVIPAQHAEQMVTAVRAAGSEAAIVAARGEPHGLVSRATREGALAAVAAFLKRVTS